MGDHMHVLCGVRACVQMTAEARREALMNPLKLDSVPLPKVVRRTCCIVSWQ